MAHLFRMPRAGVVFALLLLGLALAPTSASAAPKPAEGVLNINTATEAQLRMLPRVGEKTAQRILDYRAKRRFERVVELARVKGIGLKTIRALKPWLRVAGPTTVAAPIKLPKVPKEAAGTGG